MHTKNKRYSITLEFHQTSGEPSVETSRILFLLSEVHRICTQDRNPEWGDNKRRSQCGKVCNQAAAAADLGSTRQNPIVRKELWRLVSLRYLVVHDTEGWRNYNFFRLSELGKSFLAEQKQS